LNLNLIGDSKAGGLRGTTGCCHHATEWAENVAAVYYVHELAPIYASHGLGPERAADISPLGGLARAGVPISFHSDYPMAPAEPLKLVGVAVESDRE